MCLRLYHWRDRMEKLCHWRDGVEEMTWLISDEVGSTGGILGGITGGDEWMTAVLL